MFLKLLRIETEDEVLRELHFHKGINLIVDDTPTSTNDTNELKTGNNVGKTSSAVNNNSTTCFIATRFDCQNL